MSISSLRNGSFASPSCIASLNFGASPSVSLRPVPSALFFVIRSQYSRDINFSNLGCRSRAIVPRRSSLPFGFMGYASIPPPAYRPFCYFIPQVRSPVLCCKWMGETLIIPILKIRFLRALKTPAVESEILASPLLLCLL